MMPAKARPLAAVAAIFGAVGLIQCALASHGVHDPQRAFWLRIGGFCLMIHVAIALFGLLALGEKRARLVAGMFLTGAVVFAGSLAGIAFDGPDWLGRLPPFGGMIMILGWLALAWAFARGD